MHTATIRALLATASLVALVVLFAAPASAGRAEGDGATAAGGQVQASGPGTVSYPSHVIGAGASGWSGRTLPSLVAASVAPVPSQEKTTSSDDDVDWLSFGAGAGMVGLIAAGLAGAGLATRRRRTVGLP